MHARTHDIIMISRHNIRGYHTHKAELQAFLEDHSPDVATLNETFTKKGYKNNIPRYTAVTRNREHRGLPILLRHDLAYTEIDDIQLTTTTDNEQLMVAIRIDSNRELYVSTVYCPHSNRSIELIDGLCENRNQIILTGDFNCKHPELGNDQTNPSGTRLITATQKNNLTLINDGTPTLTNNIGKEDINDLIFISQPIILKYRDFWVGDDLGSDHFIINGVFSYTPMEMNEKTVRLFHKADWIDIRLTMTKKTTLKNTALNKMTEDEIDNYVETLTNTITSAITEKVPTHSQCFQFSYRPKN